MNNHWFIILSVAVVLQNWKPGMTEAEAKSFVIKALTFAMARDASSGGCIRTVTIDANGVRRDFLPGSEVGDSKFLQLHVLNRRRHAVATRRFLGRTESLLVPS